MVKRKTPEDKKRRKHSALEKHRPTESDEVLRALLKAHPKLKAEAEEIARSLISDVSFDEVAGDVELALEYHDLDELNSRAGKTRWGYVDPTDAALENLDSARKCLEKAGLGKKWDALVAAIKSEHSRKTSFMPGFETLLSRGSLPKQQSFLDRARKRRARQFRTS